MIDLHEELSKSYPDIEPEILADILNIVSFHIKYSDDGPSVIDYLERQSDKLQEKSLGKTKDAEYI